MIGTFGSRTIGHDRDNVHDPRQTATRRLHGLCGMRSRLAVLVAAGVLAAGCGTDVAEPGTFAGDLTRDHDAPFQTGSTEYVLNRTSAGYAMEIDFQFTNPRDGLVYFVNCNGATGLVLEKWVAGQWQIAWAPVMPLCLSPPIIVRPHDAWSGKVHVYAGEFESNHYPQFDIRELEGVYRLQWVELLSSYDADRYPFGELLPRSERVSNRFEVRVEG
jgi:hypothetical protein